MLFQLDTSQRGNVFYDQYLFIGDYTRQSKCTDWCIVFA